MNIDFSTVVKGLDGRPLKRSVAGEDGAPPELLDWTLGGLAADALLAPVQSPQGPTKEGVAARYVLATRVYGGGEHDVTPEQASMIQDAAAKSFPPLVAGPIIALMNGK